MKKYLLYLCLCGTLCACNNVEKQAGEQLQAAREAFGQGDYSRAKQLIDSIKILYPKAYETRKEGIALMCRVEQEEQEVTLVYLDSLLEAKQQELEAVKGKFVLEKDAEYETIGHYLHPSQVIEKNLHRSFLRFQTDERGQMSMTSIYCGSRNVHHVAVRVKDADGNYAETPASRDSYETTNGSEKIEKADYKLGEDGSVIDFVCMKADQTLRAEYLGEQPYSATLSAADRQAAVAVRNLSRLLTSIEEIRKAQEAARLKLEFVKRKMKEEAKGDSIS